MARSAFWLLAALLAAASAAGEVVTLRPVGVDGGLRPVQVTAELIVDNGYDLESITLPMRDGLIVVPFSREWLCDLWAGGCAATDQIRARIFLSSSGRAPVMSEAFRWPRGSDDPFESLPAIEFSLAPAPVTASEGALLIPMRPAGSRSLHLRDSDGRPLGGVSLDVAIYLSTIGHCARIQSRPLGTVTTDAAGNATIPDGDLEYHLEIETPHLAFAAAPDPHARQTLVTPLRDGVVELVVFRPAALRIEVVGVTDPATLALGGCVQDCPGGVCAACCGTLAEVTAAGEVEIDDFYPDQYSEIYLAGDGGEIWRATVRELDLSGPIVVRRPSARTGP